MHQVMVGMERPTSWTELMNALFGGAWNAAIGRFRLPYAFRGQPLRGDDLSSGLVRLAAGRVNVARLELHLDQLNINERVLFPGLDGLSRWLTRYYWPKPRPLRPRRSRLP